MATMVEKKDLEFDRDYRKDTLAGERYKSRAGISCFPITLFFTVNNKCNLRCKMCDVGQGIGDTFFSRNTGSSEMTMALKDWKRIVDEVLPYRPDICIATTEPLLYQDIIPLLSYIKEKGLTLHVTTNGFLLEEYAQKLVKIGFERLHVSIDGYEELHDEIRGLKGSFRRAISGICAVDQARRTRGVRFPEIHSYTVILPSNHDRLEKVFQVLETLPLDTVNFVHFGFVSDIMALEHNRRFKGYLPMEPSSVAKLDPKKVVSEKLFASLQAVKQRAKLRNMPVAFIPEMRLEEIEIYYQAHLRYVKPDPICLTPWRVAQVNPNGDVVPLSRCFHAVMGNVKEQAFSEIWNGLQYQKFRKHLRKNRVYPICTRCCAIF